jgi:hypothetical protein
MGIIKFKNGRVEDYTIVLANKALHHLGQLTGVSEVKYNGNLNSANELSFTVTKSELLPVSNIPYKDIQTYQDYIWRNLVDFKTVYVKELNEYFQIKVSFDDSRDMKKTIVGTSLCEAELSQANLYTIEVNTETEIELDDYEPTTFYNDEKPKFSLLHRVLQKVPQYKIGHVDKSLCDIQRTFSIDGTSIYDFLIGECSEQFDCLIKFDSATRTVSAYDLMTVCEDCGHRDDFTGSCPECGSTNLKRFGTDTTIYVDKNNLTDSIHFEMDADQVKNCFKLEAGDETMTNTIRLLNPNGTDYLYIIREDDRNDMPAELVERLDKYAEDIKDAENEIKNITGQQYDLLDKYYYYKDYMMPRIEKELVEEPSLETVDDPQEGVIYMYGGVAYLYVDGVFEAQSVEDTEFLLELAPLFETVDDETEAAKLTSEVLSPIGLKELHEGTSISTVNNAIKKYAEVFVKTAYVKLEIESSETDPNIVFNLNMNEDGKLAEDENGYHSGTWHGRIKVINLEDETYTYTSYMNIVVTDDYATFLTQKTRKVIGENDDEEEGSVYDVLSLEDIGQFEKALTLYCLTRLESFYDAIELVVEELSTIGISEPNNENKELNLLYETLYEPYIEKLDVCGEQRDIMQAKLDDVSKKLDLVEEERKSIQDDLDLETRLGEYYPIFCCYKREDKYSNSNYISDGLDNAELIEKAEEFMELARKEINKSANGQYNISSTLYNLLAMKEFQPIVNYFELGNWINVKVDKELYTLRLIGYEIDFGNLQTINVTFSTATKIENLKAQRESILKSAQNMATNFGFVSKQAEKGKEADSNIHSIMQNGLDSSLVMIKNNNKEEVIYDNRGILLREYDDIFDDYTDRQCRLTHNTIVYTTDKWKTAAQAIGEHSYTYYDKETNQFEKEIGYGLTAQFCQAANIYGGQIIGSEIYSTDYNNNDGVGSHISLIGRGKFNFGNVLKYDGANSELAVTGEINAKSGQIGSDEYDYKWSIGNDETRAYIYNGTDSMTSTTVGTYIGTDGFRNYSSNEHFVDISDGVLKCNGADINGNINITSGSLYIESDYGTYTEITNDGVLNCNSVNITGGSLSMGSEYDTYYAKISENGILECNGAVLSGTFTHYNEENGLKSVVIGNNQVQFYSYVEDNNLTGTIAAVPMGDGRQGLIIASDHTDVVGIGYTYGDGKDFKSAITIDPYSIADGNVPKLVNCLSGTYNITLNSGTVLTFNNGILVDIN